MVQICFGYGMFTGALGLHYGLEKIGATVVPTSSGNTDKQLKFMRDFGTTAIVATPSYCMYLAEAAREREDQFPMEQYQLTLGLLGSEGSTPEMRRQIEERWGGGFFATDNYGLSELNGPGHVRGMPGSGTACISTRTTSSVRSLTPNPGRPWLPGPPASWW